MDNYSARRFANPRPVMIDKDAIIRRLKTGLAVAQGGTNHASAELMRRIVRQTIDTCLRDVQALEEQIEQQKKGFKLDGKQ